MIRVVLCLVLLVVGANATSITTLAFTSGGRLVGDGAANVYTLTHSLLADTTAATVECLHGSTVLGEIGIADDGTQATAPTYTNELGNRFFIAHASTTTFTLTFATHQYYDEGVVISCRNKATTTDSASHTIALVACMVPAATAAPTTPSVGSSYVITATWMGTGTWADNQVIAISCGTALRNRLVAELTIIAAGNTVLNQDNENIAIIGADEVGGTAIDIATAKTIKLTIAKFQSDDYGKYCTFTRHADDYSLHVIPSGAASLTCGFSTLLALAIALREFMSA